MPYLVFRNQCFSFQKPTKVFCIKYHMQIIYMQNKNFAQCILEKTKDISMTSGNLSPSIEDFLQFSKSLFTCFRDFSMERKFPWIDSSETEKVQLITIEFRLNFYPNNSNITFLNFSILQIQWLNSYFFFTTHNKVHVFAFGLTFGGFFQVSKVVLELHQIRIFLLDYTNQKVY